jgi:phosphoenolpyruvate carboxykinase (GTP)
VQPADLEQLLDVDAEGWLAEIPRIREYYQQFGVRLPSELSQELDQLERRLRKTG